ncbi:SPOR domain-containing protein [Gilliamella sp. Pas-s27]|uniref:SPOR domain-containing protein n=1 Tax=Gilliamella sp. Pas-s27 TaxID=2687311 RepID=UPI0013654C6A|nr:SPOR domain-containing protein [Gilliamella sp. Pas-s27]MWP46219.1 hypothetical protein [Gilliamella sp. Pas-s27]
MRVDKEDRYTTEQPNKGAILSSKLPKLLQDCSKKKQIILVLAVAAILLLLGLALFHSSNKNKPTPLTPPEINGVDGSQLPTNDSTIHGQNDISINTNQTGSEQNTVSNTQGNQPNNQQQPDVTSNQVTPLTPPNINSVTDSVKTSTNKDNLDKNSINKKTPSHKPNENVSSSNNLKLSNNSYTIQLTASKSSDGLKKYVNQHKITNYQIYETKRNNEKWYILIKGNYSSSEEAHKAIKSLPSALQKDKPWVKSGATINKEKAAK